MLLSTLRRAPRAPTAHLSSLASMTPGGGVHGSQTSVNARRWRQKPLLRVDGRVEIIRQENAIDAYFNTGLRRGALLQDRLRRRQITEQRS